ncbi:MAG: IS4 family transposase [Planctomycetota bacterium]|nr:IS4 family transposase [Planctomycetota bacterium]
MPIVNRRVTSEEIRTMLRESPLGALRQMLPDAAIHDACRACGHEFRQRLYDPVVTVLHYLAQAVQREQSFAATWQDFWAPLAADFPEAASVAPGFSALTHARARLPQGVMRQLAGTAVRETPPQAARWRGLRLKALDSTTLSMPREAALFEHYGAHRARTTTVRYPLARFCSLLAVGTSTLIDYRFGPFRRPEIEMAGEMLGSVGPGDLVLGDRGLSGSPTLARIQARKADFLMRKNARLIVERLPVVKRLGKYDFITDLPVSKPARKLDPTLPETVRVCLFRVTWKAPSGETITEWFVTSLLDAKEFKKKTLAKLYHERWHIETSYQEFKQTFHADVLRSKTVDNIEKEFAAHVLAYQLVRRLMAAAAEKHQVKPTRISLLNAARAVVRFSQHMAAAPTWALPIHYERLLDAIAAGRIDVRPGRIEPRALTREWKHYPHLRLSRSEWRKQRLGRTG